MERIAGKTIGAVIASTVFWGGLWNAANYDFAAPFPGIVTMGELITSAQMLRGPGFYGTA